MKSKNTHNKIRKSNYSNGLTATENLVMKRDIKNGYNVHRVGGTDFILYKEQNGIIKEVIFKEVKSIYDSLNPKQRMFKTIIEAIQNGCQVSYILERPLGQYSKLKQIDKEIIKQLMPYFQTHKKKNSQILLGYIYENTPNKTNFEASEIRDIVNHLHANNIMDKNLLVSSLPPQKLYLKDMGQYNIVKKLTHTDFKNNETNMIRKKAKMGARRTKVCRGRGKKRTCVYVIRDKKGRFKRVTNIGRSIAADKRIRAKHRPKKPGYGYKGDYKKRR